MTFRLSRQLRPFSDFAVVSRPVLALAILATMPAAQAQWAADFPELEFQVLHTFSTLNPNGSTEKPYPFIPPVATPGSNGGWLLQGGTMYGAAQADAARLQSYSGLSYRLDISATGTVGNYQHWAVPDTVSWTNSDYGDLGSGRFLVNARPPIFVGGASQLAVLEKGKLTLQPPANAESYSGPTGGTGTFARDPDGNFYIGELVSLGTPTNRSYNYLLIRRNTDGSQEVLIDFADFRDPDSGAYVKGGAPTQLFWSTLDDSLYIGSKIEIAQSSATYPGIASGQTVTSVLSRIPAAALKRGNVTDDDIEVLHYFLKDTEGTIANSSTERLYGIVEDGDWLYGNGLLGSHGGLWRLNRKAPSNTFNVMFFKPQLDAVHGTDGTPPNLAGGPANGSMGPIVRALDGNIYGTTMGDASRTSANRLGVISAQGKGSLYRLVPGSLPDRSDDKLEMLRYFNDNPAAQLPYGLRAGPVIGTQQWLFGVTKDGTPAKDCGQECLAGTIFAIKITLPDVVFTQTLQSDKASYTVGERPVLSWTTTGAQHCEAGGAWNGTQQTSDRIQLPALQTAGTQQYLLTCTGATGSQLSDTTITVNANAIKPMPPTEEQVVDGGGALAPAGLLGLALLARLRRRTRR